MNVQDTLKQMREAMMMHRRSPKTIKSYLHWVKLFMAFIMIRPAEESREDKIIAFLTMLAVKKRVSANTQKQALCAVVYLCKRVLKVEIGDISAFARSGRPQYIPTVFSREEAAAVLDNLEGIGWLWGGLMYGCGLRLNEVCSLRLKDIDIDRRQISIKQSKGRKDRVLPLPDGLVVPLEKQLRLAKKEHEEYSRRRIPVSLPDALDRKYPNAPYELGWFWLFPAAGPIQTRTDRVVDPAWIGKLWHIHDSAVQKRIGRAIRDAGICKRAGCHTFRHSFATHWLESADSAQEVAIIRLQRMMGHTSARTTMIYLHCVKQKSDVPSPLDTLGDVRRIA